MFRYVAALVALLVLSLAFADSMTSSRDANLAMVNAGCLTVAIESSKASFTAASAAAAQSDITNALANKAILYSLPFKIYCTANEVKNLPYILLYFQAVGGALAYEIAVVMPGNFSGYTDPTVWSETGVMSRPTGITPKDIRDEAPKLFDYFALAWKKAHQE